MDVIEALKWLQDSDLGVVVYKKIDPDFSPYHVVEQRPEPGMTVKKNRKITLVVSEEQTGREMPDFAGRDFLEARTELYANLSGYIKVVQTIKVERFSDSVPAGMVISHSPNPGELIDLNQEIVFVVSKGILVEDFELEDYTFQDYETVLADLSRIGLNVEANFLPTKNAEDVGKIFSQNAEPGTTVEDGEKITFDVGVRSSRFTSDLGDELSWELRTIVVFVPPIDSLEQSSEGAFRRVVLQLEDGMGKREIYSRMLEVGGRERVPYKTIGSGTIKVFIDGQFSNEEAF